MEVSMSFLELRKISKTYPGQKEPCVRDMDFSVERGEIVAILGASGCGKTTVLKMVAGLTRQDAGQIVIDGEPMDSLPAEKRPIAMVFQKALLFENMNVEKNINFAPRVNRSLSKPELRARTDEMLALVHLEGLGRRRVTQLSGGQEQRVSLARALITTPKILLLDEPLSALDANLKLAMQEQIKELNRSLGATMLFVTHDQQEAVAVADRIALMQEGRMIQYAEPSAFYTRPASREAAEFFGWENFLPAEKRGTCVRGAVGTFSIETPALKDGSVSLCVRPEAAIRIGSGSLEATVATVSPRGMQTLYEIHCGSTALKLSVSARHAYRVGDAFRFDLDPEMVWAV
jgi:ABC-type Fe3+/spermidine/putrescine transport system ATPase subunit